MQEPSQKVKFISGRRRACGTDERCTPKYGPFCPILWVYTHPCRRIRAFRGVSGDDLLEGVRPSKLQAQHHTSGRLEKKKREAPGVGYPAPGIEGRSSPRNAESRADIPRSLYLIAHFMLKSARLGGQKIKSGPPGRCTTKMDPLGHHGAVGAHAAPSGRVPDLAACQASIYTGPPNDGRFCFCFCLSLQLSVMPQWAPLPLRGLSRTYTMGLRVTAEETRCRIAT